MTHTEYKSIRKQLGLTQAGLAAMLGESREIVSMRERHKTPITESAAWAIRGVMAHFSEKDLRDDKNQIN
jgi:transcriptional regulator with XRE-family HTH domain